MKKPTIAVSGYPHDMQGWYESKCSRILEELARLSSTLNRPGDAPNVGWQSKQEEATYHLGLAIKNLLILTGCTSGKGGKLHVQDIECILYEGYEGYKKLAEKYTL